MEYIATKSILVRQVDAKNKNGERYKKDVSSTKGQKINLTDEEAIALWGALDIPEAEKKASENLEDGRLPQTNLVYHGRISRW